LTHKIVIKLVLAGGSFGSDTSDLSDIMGLGTGWLISTPIRPLGCTYSLGLIV